MKYLANLFVVLTLIVSATLAFASRNNFQFQINDYHTTRQAGQTIDVYIRYGMKDSVNYSQYPDYRELRKVVLGYLEPSNDLPANTFWEIIAEKMGNDLLVHYPLSGISVQILVHPNEEGNISEPGFHGPIYTAGDVIPLSQVVFPVSSK